VGHGYVVAEYYANALARSGLPAPLVATRLLLLLGDALEAMPRREAVEAAAYRLCEAWCMGGEDPEDECLHECMEREEARIERLLERARGNG